MADETMDSVPGLGAIAYTIPYYIKFATKVIEKAALLKAKRSTTVNSPHLVEKALWTDYMLSKYDIKRTALGSTSTSKASTTTPSSSSKATKTGKVETHVDQKKDSKEKPAGRENKRKAPPKASTDKEPAQSEKRAKTTEGTAASRSTRSTRSRP
jgi:hypothetical protein